MGEGSTANHRHHRTSSSSSLATPVQSGPDCTDPLLHDSAPNDGHDTPTTGHDGHARQSSQHNGDDQDGEDHGDGNWVQHSQQQQQEEPLLTGQAQGHGHDDARSSTHSQSRSRRSSFAESEVLEMDFLASDDDFNDDEETGLTAKERRQRWKQRKRQRRELDARIVDGKISKDGKRLADAAVVKRLGLNAVLIGLWYIFSLSISIYNKWMFSPDHLDFKYPLFTTSLHMVVQFTLSSLVLYIFPSLRPQEQPSLTGPPKPIITKLFYFSRLVPCGTATSLDVGLGNMSLKFISLTFLTMCKSSALAFVLLFAFLFRLETPSLKLILIIGTMTIGVVMMVAGEASFNAVGFGLIIASAFFSGFRWGLTQILLLRHPATSNPFAMLFFLTPIMFVTLICIALAVEGPLEIAHGIGVLTSDGVVRGIAILLFPGTLAFCMIASEFALLQRSSVVTLSICGIFKEVVTISAAGIVFHDPLTPINVSGLIITMAAIGSYNYMKVTKMRREARLDVAEGANAVDPDTDSDDENTALNGHPPHSGYPSPSVAAGSSRLPFAMPGNNTTARDGTYSPIDTNEENTLPPHPTRSMTPGPDEHNRGRLSARTRVNGTGTGASSSLAPTAGPADPSLRSPLRTPYAGGHGHGVEGTVNGSANEPVPSRGIGGPGIGVLQRSASWKARSVSPQPPLALNTQFPGVAAGTIRTPDKMSRD
ncbi:Triose-phosphate Transporter [Emmonsiellopsis sp. PD_33]|nr:Triose-phosphate Transporter [Emmonsiellopsis sp. PD_33]